MLIRSHLTRAMNNSGVFSGGLKCWSIPVNTFEKCRPDRLTITSRLYSDSGEYRKKRPPQSSEERENKTSKSEETLEVFDLEKERSKLTQRDLLSKYTVFKDEDSPIILDVEEQRLVEQSKTNVAHRSEFEGISLERGLRGVFEVDELVAILRDQSAEDIVVIEMPKELGYADQMIIVSGRSRRHILAMATFVRLLFKKKRHETDMIPAIEGKKTKSDSWFALDLGNIVLHLFLRRTRELYDLESLWALGPEYDPILKDLTKGDQLTDIIQKHSLILEDLQPADAK